MNEKIKLLNQTAEALLEQVGEEPLPSNTPPILQLAMLTVQEGQEDSDHAILIANSKRSPAHTRATLEYLAENLEPEDLENLDPVEAGRSVLTELEPD